MASEGEIAAAEAAVRDAEANLESLLGRSINNGSCSESAGRGLELKRLRDEVTAAKRQLQELRNN